MNSSNIYELWLGLSMFTFLVIIIAIFVNIKCNKSGNLKKNIIFIIIAFFLLWISESCYIKIKNTYKEVYYLEYTVYYPSNTCKFKVDSCNHIYSYSSQGTNRIIYYSIPKKDTYSTETTAPIFINKIIKK